MLDWGFNPAPKPQHKRAKKTAKQRGDISDKTREEVRRRSGGRCERCGWINGTHETSGCKWGLQCSHLIRRPHVKGETNVNDLAMLCGPSVNTGTCHWWIDNTREGREWAAKFRDRLMIKNKEEAN